MSDNLPGSLSGKLAQTALLAAQYRRERDEARVERDELRRAIELLLDEPARDDGEVDRCVFCWVCADVEQELRHAPGCPVLRKDTLLGREPM